MCGIFGFTDTHGVLTPKQRQILMKALAVAAEVRGTDSAGIAYNSKGKLNIYKRPVPAHRLSIRFPVDVATAIGHTRYATQGEAKYNRNNHPFKGNAGFTEFALAHNGVLYNDVILQREEELPKTNIETDSYVAVQLLEKSGRVSISSLVDVAEKLNGSFALSVLNSSNDLYLVKGSNPITHYRFSNGVFVYASTDEIIKAAMHKLSWKMRGGKLIELRNGDILKISSSGKLKVGNFTPTEDWHFLHKGYFSAWDEMFCRSEPNQNQEVEDLYAEEVLNYAQLIGVTECQITLLKDFGYDIVEIGEMLYDAELLEMCLDEILCDNRCKNRR